MELLKLFWAFFISNLLGYGGGPSTIPLIQREAVDHYHFMTLQQFGNVLAVANALPGPIAPKLGGYIGYDVAGWAGAVVALIATIAPSAVGIILLYKFVSRFKDSPWIQAVSHGIQPVIAVLLAVLAWQFIARSWEDIGVVQTALLAVLSFVALERLKIHPAWVVAAALGYGAIFLS